jgi:hypothetical protein
MIFLSDMSLTIYPHHTPGGIIELVEKREYDPQDLADARTFCRLWNVGKECYLAKTIQDIITKS